jgi:hypothetical protein
MRHALAFGMVLSLVSIASRSSAAPGDLLMTIHSPSPLYTGFGHGLSVSGNEIAIGAYGRQNYDVVFRYDAVHGNRLATYPSGTSTWSGFGASVAYDGDRILAGGPFFSGDLKGRASVINTANGQILKTNLGTAGSLYGWATAISGSFYAVSAMGADRVYVYNRQTHSLNYTLASTGSFGLSLSAQNDRLLVGAPRTPNAVESNAGAAYLYEASSQRLLKTFRSPNPKDLNFGWDVAQREGQLLIGALYSEVGGGAYLFEADTGELLQTFRNPSPTSENRFGWSVAFSGDYVVIGAPMDGTGAEPPGAAYAFHIDSGDLAATLSDPEPLGNGEFGWRVAGFNGMAVVSGHCNGIGVGDVYFFAVPEPSTLALLSMGGVALTLGWWRRRRQASATS